MVKKPRKKRNLSVYANLSHRRKTKKDAEARKRAAYLASLPKHPIKRILYRLHPKRVAKYWFSKKGAFMALKIVGVTVLLMVVFVGALFAYFRKDLDQIRPGELAKRVQTTVTRYYDRNDVLLWEDKGTGNYKLTVDSGEINQYVKDATIAAEDREFYSHNGVSFSGLMRAAINNATSDSVQGGSTLTQQLVKQVYFADEAQMRGLNGIPRKIKEVILSIEVERMYDKDKILSLYLNESPYGGRRNGIQSAAQSYFGKSAKDLNLAEASLLAAIPQNPSVFDPYNVGGHQLLIDRQHYVLNAMAEEGYITKAEAEEAKSVPILDTIQPGKDQYADIKAPHFVQMARAELESQLGKATVGRGGLTVKTTLDYRIQQKLEEAMNEMFTSGVPEYAGFTNGSATLEDVQTGQIIAMMGSRDFNYSGFGQDNAATAFIQPGSTIKPFVYAEFLKGNFGSGTVLSDVRTDFGGGYRPNNADKGFRGNINIRSSLAQSRNIPAIKAMQVAGVEPTWDLIHETGNPGYCTRGIEVQAGLSSAIGSCTTRQVDHVNAFATLARGGVYKPHSNILEVKNGQGEELIKWKDNSEKVLDPEIAYIISDMLTDQNARVPLIGGITQGFLIPGVKTATKTGTSDIDGQAKDLWMMSYSPVLSMGAWLGNSDTRVLNSGNSTLPGPIVSKVMEYAHQIYAQEDKYKANQWLNAPQGIQRIGGELYPSWYDKSKAAVNTKMTFDRLSKKRATDCTPPAARIEIDVIKMKDPSTDRDIFQAPDGYDATREDDLHKCEDSRPDITDIDYRHIDGNRYSVIVTVKAGTHSLSTLDVTVGGQNIAGVTGRPGANIFTYTMTLEQAQTITATISDTALYKTTKSGTLTPLNDDDDD